MAGCKYQRESINVVSIKWHLAICLRSSLQHTTGSASVRLLMSNTYVASDLPLHQSMRWCTKTMNVALHCKLEVVTSGLPVLEPILYWMMRVCRNLVKHILHTMAHGIVHTCVDGVRSGGGRRGRGVRGKTGWNERIARLGLRLGLRSCIHDVLRSRDVGEGEDGRW